MRQSTQSTTACLLFLAVLGLLLATPVSARGGGSNIMNSPGYQRALEESRKRYRESYSQSYTKPSSVHPRKAWRRRGKS